MIFQREYVLDTCGVPRIAYLPSSSILDTRKKVRHRLVPIAALFYSVYNRITLFGNSPANIIHSGGFHTVVGVGFIGHGWGVSVHEIGPSFLGHARASHYLAIFGVCCGMWQFLAYQLRFRRIVLISTPHIVQDTKTVV